MTVKRRFIKATPQASRRFIASSFGAGHLPSEFRNGDFFLIDPTNPVVALCAEGMNAEGLPDEARRLFEQAWAARTDDYEAAIAAHYLARHQAAPADTLHWNLVAVHNARADSTGRSTGFMASLYLNLADAHANVGEIDEARTVIRMAAASLDAVADGGYREFVAMGVQRLAEHLGILSEIEAGF